MNIAVYSMFCLDAEVIMRTFARNNGLKYFDTARLCGYCNLDDVEPKRLDEWNAVNEFLEKETTTGESVVLFPHGCRSVINPFRVMLWCNPEVSAKRMVDAKMASSIEDAIRKMKTQIEYERDAAKDLYLGYDITDPGRYSLILDCTYLPIVEISMRILDRKNWVYLDKRNLIPTKPYTPDYLNRVVSVGIPVHMHDMRWYVSNDHVPYASQIKKGKSLLTCYVELPSSQHVKEYSYKEYETALLPKKEENKMINNEYLQNVKAVLFGNQKQANVINDSVVAIVAQYLDGANQDMSTQEATAASIYTELKACADAGLSERNSTFIQLVSGRKSYDVLKEGLPYVVSQNQPNVDSPKYNFRILVVGEDDVEDTVENGEGDVYAGMKFDKPAAAPDEVLNPDDTVADQVRKLKDAILPMCPDGVKQELDDEYAQALYCAQAYFDYNSR